MEAALQQLGRYQVVGKRGHGGMGVVYEARDPNLQRRVALKVLSPELTADARFVERFLREGRLLAALSHPNVVTVFEAGECDGQYFLAMEFVEGTDLAQLIRQQGALAPELAFEVLEKTAAGLQAIHDQGIVHRDIKPENILLDAQCRVKIADFGIARAETLAPVERSASRLGSLAGVTSGTQFGTIIGTPEYMSPEQAMGQGVDTRSDIYSLACVAYELLAGEPPFGRTTAERTAVAIITDHARSQPPRILSRRRELGGQVDRALQRALAKQPEDRHRSAGEFVADLRPAQGRRHKALRSGAVAAGTVLGVLGAVWLFNPAAPEIRTGSLKPATAAKPYHARLEASGSALKWQWGTEQPPAGFQLTAAGELTGTPARVGTLPLLVRVRNGRNREVTRELTLEVRGNREAAAAALAEAQRFQAVMESIFEKGQRDLAREREPAKRVLILNGVLSERAEARQNGLAAAERALQLDPDLQAAYEVQTSDLFTMIQSRNDTATMARLSDALQAGLRRFPKNADLRQRLARAKSQYPSFPWPAG